MNLDHTVVMVLDMQRDFCDADGVYARHGFDVNPVKPLIPRIRHLMEVAQRRQIPTVGTQLTILENLKGEAMGLGHLAVLRPFFKQEGFRAGSPGQDWIHELPRPNYLVRKWGYLAMYQTELEKVLTALEAETVV